MSDIFDTKIVVSDVTYRKKLSVDDVVRLLSKATRGGFHPESDDYSLLADAIRFAYHNPPEISKEEDGT